MLFLANRYVALALALLAPVIVNILCFHSLVAAGRGQAGGIHTSPEGALLTVAILTTARTPRQISKSVISSGDNLECVAQPEVQILLNHDKQQRNEGKRNL